MFNQATGPPFTIEARMTIYKIYTANLIDISFRELDKQERNNVWQTRPKIGYANVKTQSYIWVNRCVCLNGTSRSVGDGNHLEDNIPKTPQLVYSPIAGYSEYQRKQNLSEKKLATG